VLGSKVSSDSVISPKGTAPGLDDCPSCGSTERGLGARTPGVAPDGYSSLLRLRSLISMAEVEADAVTIAPAEGRSSLSNFCRNSSTLVTFSFLEVAVEADGDPATIASTDGRSSPSNLRFTSMLVTFLALGVAVEADADPATIASADGRSSPSNLRHLASTLVTFLALEV
jgi:hypothetical protein